MSHPRPAIRRATLGIAVAFIATAMPGLTSAQAQATHVAVVVDFGGSGGTTAHCSPAGGSGFAVLDNGYTVATNKTGLVTKINSVGLDQPPKDLYWSYWHYVSGAWAYASTGPATYTPTAGNIEGWVYGDGKTPPPSASYASICAGRDPAPPPTHSARPTPRPTHSSSHHPAPPTAVPPPVIVTTPGTHSTADGSPAPGSSATGSSLRTGNRPARSTPRTAAPGSALPGSASTDTATGSSDTAGVLPQAPPKATATKRSGIPTWGTALAIAVVVALGGAAYWRTRVQRQKSS